MDDLVNLIKDIHSIRKECSESDWDGYGAVPVSDDDVDRALTLLNKLPDDIILPEAGPEPSGTIGLEWRRGDNSVAVAMGKDNAVHYGGILSGAGCHGNDLAGAILILQEHFKL